jgi:putative redox protein
MCKTSPVVMSNARTRRRRVELRHNRDVTDTKPPVTAELIWDNDSRFGATSGPNAIVVDGDSVAGPSPMQLAAFAVGGCMAIDVVSILKKGRHPVTGLRASFSGERAAEPPRRYVRLALHFHVTGVVPTDAVERAIALSREKYCSVWQTFRQDIELSTTYEVRP